MTIEEAANFFGVSKEAIHNRIRRGRLKAVVEDGVKLVLISQSTPIQKPKSNKLEEKFNSFLEEQNKELKAKIEQLEQETRTLREEKERYLIEERIRIEQIYKEKDEQLKNILNAISSKFLLEAKPLEEDHIEEAQIEITPTQLKTPKLISLKEFIDSLALSKKKEQKLKEKIKKLAKKDKRFIKKEKKIYLDIQTYDYSDIVATKKGKK